MTAWTSCAPVTCHHPLGLRGVTRRACSTTSRRDPGSAAPPCPDQGLNLPTASPRVPLLQKLPLSLWGQAGPSAHSAHSQSKGLPVSPLRHRGHHHLLKAHLDDALIELPARATVL